MRSGDIYGVENSLSAYTIRVERKLRSSAGNPALTLPSSKSATCPPTTGNEVNECPLSPVAKNNPGQEGCSQKSHSASSVSVVSHPGSGQSHPIISARNAIKHHLESRGPHNPDVTYLYTNNNNS